MEINSRRSSQWSVLDYKPPKTKKNLLKEYSENSTIHGVKYLGEHGRSWFERIWWIFVFFLSIYGCVMVIYRSYHKWDENPIIVTFDKSVTPIWEVPFPAVTICPEIKVSKKAFNFTKIYKNFDQHFSNMSQDIEERLSAITHICNYFQLPKLTFFDKTMSQKYVQHFKDIALKFNETLFQCKWRNSPSKNCSVLFTELLTDEGICFTFNILNSSEIYKEKFYHGDHFKHSESSTNWSLENGYGEIDATVPSYPVRAMGTGTRAGLFVVLRLFEEDFDDFYCRNSVKGFKFVLHNPEEVPQLDKKFFWIPIKKEILASVKPKIMTTSDNLKDYSPNRRKCFFGNEKYLHFFTRYTQQNCELECLANFTLSKCGCVKFSMPRDKLTPICGAANIECYEQATDQLILDGMADGDLASSSGTKNKAANHELQCNCLPACTSIDYEVEISQAHIDWKKMYLHENPLEDLTGSEASRLLIFFKEKQFIKSVRSELYGLTDFLASCGGLLGLFMGVSLLSFIEILYYSTIRLFNNWKNQKKKNRKIIELFL